MIHLLTDIRLLEVIRLQTTMRLLYRYTGGIGFTLYVRVHLRIQCHLSTAQRKRAGGSTSRVL